MLNNNLDFEVHPTMRKITFAFGLVALLVACQAAPQPVAQTGIIEGIADGSTRVVDLTHTLNPENPYWPGEGYAPFAYEVFETIEEDGALAARFMMAEHTGTHLDAPNHFVEGRASIDQIPLQQLIVSAIVIDVRAAVAENPDYLLATEDILNWESANGKIESNTFVFMYTGWDERWTDYNSYKNTDEEGNLHFPGFSPGAAELLVTERDVAGLGIDTLSVDYGLSGDFNVHHISNTRNKYHLENVANLGELPTTGTQLIIAPIKIENGTGGPTRIYALLRN